MILVTGGTGFVGKALISQLSEMGKPVRILLRPSPDSPSLPKGTPVEVAVCSLRDERGIRAALKGVQGVYHLAGAERKGSRSDLTGVDVEGTKVLAEASAQAGVERLIFLSHLGADRFSAYPVLKAKAIAENHIINSGVGYSILRSSVIFGPNDQFTTKLAWLIKYSPGIFLIPGYGETQIQPLFINDLVSCLAWILKDPEMEKKLISLGGGEYFSFRQVIEILMTKTGIRRSIRPISPAYLRILSVVVEQFVPGFPVSIFWLDYLAADRTCSIDSMPRTFGINPARFEHNLEYLRIK